MNSEQERRPDPEGPPLTWADMEEDPASRPVPRLHVAPRNTLFPSPKLHQTLRPRERMTQVGCETSSPPCPPPHVCCCPASVHATGMVVDSGAVPPTRCPMVRASPAPHQHLGLANSDLRDDLIEILTEKRLWLHYHSWEGTGA